MPKSTYPDGRRAGIPESRLFRGDALDNERSPRYEP